MAGLSPAELLEMALNGESLDGDEAVTTGANDNGDTADGAGTAADTAGQSAQGQAQDKQDTDSMPSDEPVGAPIASKSGAYTIPYQKLEQARTHAKNLESQNAALLAQVAELTAKQQANLAAAEDNAQARADAGQAQTPADQNLEVAKTAIGQGVDASVFGDFSEEAIANGIATLMRQTREQLLAELREESAKVLKPLKDQQAKEANDSHFGAIYQKHPDADEIVQSGEFSAWLKSLPSFSRAAVQGVLDPTTGGNAAEVIEVFDTFKAQTGKAVTASRAQGYGKASEVQRRVPNSLSEAAGEQHQDVSQQVLAMASTNPTALMERMQDMTPEQIERVLNAV